MAAPPTPTITPRPVATDQTLQFYWTDEPTATSYDLSGNGVVTNILAPATTYTVTGLTNGTPYTYTLVAKNINGDSPPATFRTVQPGFKPNPPTGITVTYPAPIGSGQITVSWTYPSPLPIASLLGTVLRAYPLDSSGNLIDASSQGYSVPYGQTSYTLTLPTTSLWNISVRVVNDPGYSPNTTFTGPLNTASTSSMIVLLDVSGYNSIFPFATYYGSLFSVNDTAPAKANWVIFSTKQTQYGLIVLLQDNPNTNTYKALFIADNVILYETASFTVDGSFTTVILAGRMNQKCSVLYLENGTTNANYFTYDWVARTDASGTIDTGVSSINATADGALDSNIAVQLVYSGTYSYYRFSDSSFTPTLIVGPTAGQAKVANYHQKNAWIASLNAGGTLYEQLAYLPNSGAPTIYDISGLGIVSLSQFFPLSPNSAVIYDATTVSAYTFNANNAGLIDLSGTYTGSSTGDTSATSAISPYLGGTRSMGAVMISSGSDITLYTNVSGSAVFVPSPSSYVVGTPIATSDFAGTIALEFGQNYYRLFAVDLSGNVDITFPNFGLNFFQVGAQYAIGSYNSYATRYINVGGANNLYQISANSVKVSTGDGATYSNPTLNPASNMVTESTTGDTRWFTDLLPTNLPYAHKNGVYSLFPSTNQTATLALRLPYADLYKSYTDFQLGINLDISFNDTSGGVYALPSAWIVYSLGASGVRLRAITSNYTDISYNDPSENTVSPLFQNTDTTFMMILGTNVYTYNIVSQTFAKQSLPTPAVAATAIYTTYEPKLSSYPY